MANEVARVAGVSVAAVTSASAGDFGASGRDRDSARDDGSRYRLIIEKGPGNAYVYKTLDRLTGEVIRQFPQEQVLKLMTDPSYDPGRVFGASV